MTVVIVTYLLWNSAPRVCSYIVWFISVVADILKAAHYGKQRLCSYSVMADLYFWHDLQSTGGGAAHCTLIVQYYNRNVSGWEPFVEPWK